MKSRSNSTPSARQTTVRLSAGPRAKGPRRSEREPTDLEAAEEISRLREALDVERLVLEAEHRALTEAHRELEVSRDRYADLFDSAPLGFATLSLSGAIDDINLTGAALLGRERTFLLGKPMMPLVAKSDRRKFLGHLSQVRQSNAELKTELHFHRGQCDDLLLEFTSIVTRRAWDDSTRIRTTFRDVTEQRRAEQAASAAEAQLSLMSDLAPVMLARCSRDLRYLFVNRACAEFLGRRREEIIGKPIAEIMGEAGFEAIRPYVEKVLEGRSVEFELEVPYSAPATPRYMRVAYRPERDERGRVIGWVAAINDISDRKEAEAALRQAHNQLEERVRERTAELQRLNLALKQEILAHKRDALARDQLAAIVESSTDAILSRNLKDTFISWNKGAERLFGYTAAEAVGCSVDLIVPSERREELRRAEDRLRQGELIEPFETERVRKDGTRLEVWLSLSPIRDAKGRITGIAAIERDIGEQRRAENALRESEARLRAIMDNSSAIIFLKDLQGRYVHVNRQFGEVFHVTSEQVVGKTDEEIFPPNQAAAFRASDLKMLEAGSPMVFNEVARHTDGLHTSIVSKFPLFDLDGKIYALGGIVTDVTERKRLEEEIVRISEYEQQRIAQDLHDGLGQQLAGTWFLTDTLRKALAAQSSPELATASKIVQLLETAVSQVRTLAQGLSPVSSEANGLMAALQALAAHCSELFAVNCHFVCPEPVLINDNNVATHLYRIAQEAINNAVRHGKATRIEIGLVARNGSTALRVVDNGIGFKKNAKPDKGMGLRTMNYRADLIGADFAINKQRRKGTEVICSLRTS